ncbi:MAG TPA: amino acid ABC transporter substrate-binding protein [Ktedonobacteraceae bacterium]|jgi:branched-chain amino acid transport system substrate-binding protein|nr:amino acid ABC transporter substrate-binding protein [Ktedonobacteraceae bacterium]
MVVRYTSGGTKCFSIIGIVTMILAGLSACSQGGSGTIAFTNQSPITIGASISIKGDFAADAAAVLKGYQLWAQTINNSGGLLGRPVKLVILNDDSTQDKVKSNYDTLITKDHVDLLFGPFSTLLTKPAATEAHKYHYAFVEGEGGGPSLFDPTQGYGFDDLFCVTLPAANNLETFADYILSLPLTLNGKPYRPATAAYATSDDPFTQPQLQLAETMLEQGGIKTVYSNANSPYSADDPNYVTKFIPGVAQKIVDSKAQVVLLGTQFPDVIAYLNVFKKDHYNPQAIIATAGPDQGQDFIKGVGGVKYTEGMFVPNGWYPQANTFGNAQMVQAYLAQYGGNENDINADVAEAYSTGQVLEQAITRIHSLDNTKLVTELHNDVFNTVQGPAEFPTNLHGMNSEALAYLFQWQMGNFIPVYPSSAAAENPEFPKVNNY